ncbi:Exopolysaccharide biosynthesis polyprenyl glycosylphosphotransferase [Rhodovastum atsumiense]|nr:Exopolysaccharide biosynthesis polyprenyl glycosylphosphotransferase [Rhodovastum atsumiense]
MDNTMSRLGGSVHSVALAPGVVAFSLRPADFGRSPVAPALLAALVLLLDLLVCVLAAGVTGWLAPGQMQPLATHAGLLLPPLCIAAIAGSGGYRMTILCDTAAQVTSALAAAAAALAIVWLATAVLLGAGEVMTAWTVTGAAVMLPLLAVERGLLAAAVLRDAGQRFGPRTVIVGLGPAGARRARHLGVTRPGGLRVVGLLGDEIPVGPDDDDEQVMPPHLGPVEHVFMLMRRGLVDRVVLAQPCTEEWRIGDLIMRLADYPVEICFVPDIPPIGPGIGLPARGDAIPLLPIAHPPLSGARGVVKRVEDLVIASVALVLCAIPMLAIALAIQLDSPGPVLFRQWRTGFGNRDFRMFKFRTMYHHMTDHEARQQTTRNDPRVTRVGAILRRTSLDELPQIFNVLRGEMSIVGPRPHAPGTRAAGRTFDEVVERYAARHRVRPGLTGLAQVRGLRGETRTEDRIIRRVESDLEYIDSWSLWLDLKILARTAVIVLRMKNAY